MDSDWINEIGARGDSLEVLVLDSNALIRGHGFDLYNKAKRVVTIAEVQAEIRDSKAKDLLSRLPFTLEILNPSAEACQEGMLQVRFFVTIGFKYLNYFICYSCQICNENRRFSFSQ